MIDPNEARDGHVEDFIADLIAATSAANALHHYRNLRVYFGWLVRRTEMTGMSRNPMDDVEPPRVPTKLTPVLSDDEETRVLATCAGRDFESVRDLAIMLMFRDTGLRVSELCRMDKNRIDFQRRRFLTIGKGGHERWVGFGRTLVWRSRGISVSVRSNPRPIPLACGSVDGGGP